MREDEAGLCETVDLSRTDLLFCMQPPYSSSLIVSENSSVLTYK